MPTYDYSCAACGHTFEVIEKMHEERAKACPKCGKKKAVRKITVPGAVIFKGSGFYVTDNKRGSSTGGDPKKKTTRKTVDKTDSKTDSKSESKSTSDKTEKK